jgi:hypothetical protein
LRCISRIGRTRVLGRAGHGLHFRVHDPVGGKGQHFADKISVSLLLHEPDQRHFVVGHRQSPVRFQGLATPNLYRNRRWPPDVAPGALRYARGSVRGLPHHQKGHNPGGRNGHRHARLALEHTCQP